jgi:tetratricopeptide (TPR) repeat protein
MSSVGSELGQALYAQERFDEAAEWCRLAEEHAPAGDVWAQSSWRGLRGKLLARTGAAAQARELEAESVRLLETTDGLNQRGEAWLDYAQVLSLGDQHSEASACIERALELFVQKQNDVLVATARALLVGGAVA